MTTLDQGGPVGPSGTLLPDYPEHGLDDAVARKVPVSYAPTDQVFRQVSRAAGAIVLALMILIGVFLTVNSIEAISSVGIGNWVTTQEWAPENNSFGIAAVLPGSVVIAIVALVVAVPLSIGAALFITEIAAGRVKRMMTAMVDLMAAVPSLVYGIWGLAYFQSHVVPFAEFLAKYFGWIPIFDVQGVDPANPLPNPALYTSSFFIAGIIVSLMVIPIQTSIMVESFSRAPQGEKEGAFALGATKWGMIRNVVLPFGKGGIIGAVMLGLGRALGETIAVYLIISPLFEIKFRILENGAVTIAAMIAQRYGEANDFSMSALMSAGLALFILTMIVNFTASSIIARSRSGAESEG